MKNGYFSFDSPGTPGDDYILTFIKDETEVKINVSADQVGNIDAKIKFKYPLRNIYHLFENYPERLGFGPNEPTQANTQCKGFWPNNSTEEGHPCYKIPDYIGGQLHRHNMIFIGERYRVIKLIKDGEIIWKYNTKNEPENNDIWVLSNGHVLYAHQWYIEEVTPDKQVVWTIKMPGEKRYKVDPEVHSCQPIGQDTVVFLVNYPEGARIETYDKKTRTHTKSPLLEGDYKLNDPHGQARRLRVRANRNYVVSTMGDNYFHEYDSNFKLIHSFTSPNMGGMWGGVPLKNGNYILQRESQRTTVEMDRDGNVVWQVSLDELGPQLIDLGVPEGVFNEITKTQMCERLVNGNTVMFIRGCRDNRPQCLEVTPDKKVVWILQDRHRLGDGLHAHFLEQPGYPEIPGDIEH